MNNEKIITKIKKVLELSKNNNSKEEAMAAALQAQKLLAKYHIDMTEVEGIDLDKIEEIDECEVEVGMGKNGSIHLLQSLQRILDVNIFIMENTQ